MYGAEHDAIMPTEISSMHADLLPYITRVSFGRRNPTAAVSSSTLQLQELGILPPTTNLSLLSLLELPSHHFRLLTPRTSLESQAIDPQALVATSSRGPSALTTTPEPPGLMFSAPAKM